MADRTPTKKSQGTLYVSLGVVFTLIALLALFAIVQLKTHANSALETADVGNTAPVVDSVTVSDTSGSGDISTTGFTPNEGTDKTLYVRGTVEDANGCSDIAQVDVKVFRSGVTNFCSDDDNNCYSTSTTTFTGCTGAGVDTADFEVAIPQRFYIDPTDSGPYNGQTWRVYTTVTDNSSAVGSYHGPDYPVNSVAAFSVSPSTISYGTVALGDTSAEQTVTFTNTGNRDEDSLVSADHDMTSNLSGYNDIPASNVHASTTEGFSYSDPTSLAITTSDQDLPIGLVKETTPSPTTADSYWLLQMPSSGVNGTYTNTLTFTASAL